MGNYKIRMKIELIDESNGSEVIEVSGDELVPEKNEANIDFIEKKYLNLSRDTIRKSFSEHLKMISKKKTEEKQKELKGKVCKNARGYSVDGEIGRLSFETHSIVRNKKTVFNSGKEIFKMLRAHEWYRTESFNELAFDYVKDLAYENASSKLNRIRGCLDGEGTPYRTLENIVKIEAREIDEKIERIASETLEENGYSFDGKPKEGIVDKDLCEARRIELSKEEVGRKLEEYNKGKEAGQRIDKRMVKGIYEDPSRVVNISIDDVGVKHQKASGRSPLRPKKEKREYVENTIAHIEHKERSYYFNFGDLFKCIKMLIVFLLRNDLTKNHLQFYVDGARRLHNAIIKGFKWFRSIGIILDWYHLKEKCKIQLSLGCKNSEVRNEILSNVLSFLWLGKIDRAIKILMEIEGNKIKSNDAISTLIGYFERNRSYIPCYALRKELVLRNSSNRGEKSNDLLVSHRQKHNGMSWSKEGSIALATITCLYKNNEQKNWFENNTIKFDLAA